MILAAAAVVTVTGCAGSSGGSTESPGTTATTETATAAADQSSPNASSPAASTLGVSSLISVTSGDASCVSTAESAAAGRYTINVHNTADQITDVYLYGAGDTVITEITAVAPNSEKSRDVDLPAGTYQLACEPRTTGSSTRIPLSVTN